MLRALLAAGLLLCAWLPAQETAPVLENDGRPMRVPFQCPPEDMEMLGLACPAEAPCDALLELAAVESAGARIFLIGNIHTASVTLYSVLLATSDSGKTWREAHSRILNGSLDQIQMLDYLNGWISGQLAQPLPHDPFLLKTTDGGATWRRYPLFSEPRAGVIESFRFNTPANGWLWVDRITGGQPGSRYERYESVTGGESWMLRQAVAKLPKEAVAPAPREDVWRLRADAASNSFRLEKNTENGWQVVALFEIRVGACQTPATALSAAPPEQPAPVGGGVKEPLDGRKRQPIPPNR